MDDKHGKMIERIYDELVGDEYTEGVIPKVERIERKVETHTLLFRIGIGVFVVLASVAAVLADVLGVI